MRVGLAIKAVLKILFPAQPRSFLYRRSLLTLIRALHILCTGVLIGGYIFQQPLAVLNIWLSASIISGLMLFAIDLHASMAVLFEVRGCLLYLKIILLLLLSAFPGQEIAILISVLFIGAIGSHMPKRHRHKLLLFEKFIIPDERSG